MNSIIRYAESIVSKAIIDRVQEIAKRAGITMAHRAAKLENGVVTKVPVLKSACEP